MPALRNGAVPGSHRWFITTFSPGGLPFEELHRALLRVAIGPPPDLIDQLTAGEDGIHQVVQRLLPDDDTQLFIVIDQFEELFTQCESTTVHSFLEALASAVSDPHSRLRVVVTLRADFYDRPLRYRRIGELLRHGTELVTPMSPREVERAITGPAERVGARFDRGLVAEIVADVAEHPDALPLLQYALTEMYERRRHGAIEQAAYDEIGRLAAALARRAEDVYRSFDANAQSVTRQVLLRMVNATGRRFVDEGADFRSYTYAKYGAVILAQPEQFAWQIFDQKVVHLLRDEYRIRQVTKVEANTIEELATKLEGVNEEGFLDEIRAYNAAVRLDTPFDPTVKDGRCLQGSAIPKSNWANTIDTPPFVAFQVTCGITFTFGGIAITPDEAQVVGVDRKPIPGLFAAGEVVGGLFYFNYPAGTGLTSGSVFGRLAGHTAALFAKERA